jgi:hypothetical protein
VREWNVLEASDGAAYVGELADAVAKLKVLDGVLGVEDFSKD